jgi:hypothetical protein
MLGSNRCTKAGAAAILVLASLSVGMLVPGSVLAKCDPNRPNIQQHYFDGWSNTENQSNVGGIYSSILNYSPWVYPYDGSSVGVSAWVMLTAPGGSGISHYAQIGWVEYPYGSRGTFDQWTSRDGKSITGNVWYGGYPVGQHTFYTMLYNNPPGYFSFEANGTLYDQPAATFTPTGVQNYGEIATEASQMPGGYNSPEDFAATNWWINGRGWIALNGAPNSYNYNYWGNSKSSSTDLTSWDWACSS